ncbi:hypothetical protein PSTG_06311 [Puccinia striiformis f. sp. tritici PST-78]|uniref:No apical meristem-associated C-terminal domain-containing protein n=1 Tax=Puccinia striiformis f. sp. tritici PST-78 TaxID=1165861 RepID=A0A0L0VM99_9BASI|nr:hypothetical protein PSTG_06311 [Puccinia striiformis f. sp. tritici PST-78]
MGALDQMLELLSQQVIPAINPVRSSGIPDPTIDLASPPPTNTPKEKQKNHKKKRLAVDVEDNVDGKRSKGNNYQESELMELCTAWVALSEYSRSMGKSSTGHNQFQGCVIQVEELDPSGYVTQDQLDMAQDLYKKDQGKSCGHGRICEIEGSSGRFRSHKLRKGLKSAGAAVQGTALSTMIEANADPRKLLDRISTNQKDIVHKELAGKVAPIRPEGKEPDLSILLESSAATSDLPAPDSELTQTGLQSNNPESTQPEVQSGTVPKQPIGKKKAKALHQAKGKGVDNWKDNVATAQNEIAAQEAKRQNDIFDREATSLESIAKTAEANAEMAIMNKALTNCNETVRKYFELKQKVIIEALGQLISFNLGD